MGKKRLNKIKQTDKENCDLCGKEFIVTEQTPNTTFGRKIDGKIIAQVFSFCSIEHRDIFIASLKKSFPNIEHRFDLENLMEQAIHRNV